MEREREFEQLFRAHHAQLVAFASRMVADREVCRDVVGEAFEQAYRQWHRLPADSRLAFLYRLVRNKCVDHVRHQQVDQRYAQLCLQAYELDDDGSALQRLAEQERQLEQVEAIMRDMTPKTRLVLERCFLGQRRYREVAEEMGVSVSAVRKHVVAALRMLRERMAKKSE